MTNQLPNLVVSAGDRFLADDSALDRASGELGVALPESYREFARRYGYGLTAGLFTIYVPVDSAGAQWNTDIVGQSSELRRELDESLDEAWEYFGPEGSLEIVRRLVPFAGSENGDIIAWDPRDATSADELRIYRVGPRKSYVKRFGEDLGEMLRRAGPATFTPRPPRG